MSATNEITYNLAQLAFIIKRVLITILEWGRGTGKSTILARAIIDNVTQLPRSTGVLVAETYAQIKTRTLPSTIQGLEQHGYIKGVHFFVGRRPPEAWNWPEPYQPPLDYKHCIIFWNGTVMLFLSQDGGAASGRGLNVDWVVGDEAARLNKEKFETDVLLTNRGNMYSKAEYPDGTWKYFKDCPLHHSIVLASSTPVTASGMWFIQYDELARLHPDKYVMIRASAEVNRHNLGDEYFANARATMPDFLYKAEVENIRITRVEDGFYPLLNDTAHTYNDFNNEYYFNLANNITPDCQGDHDLDLDSPLIAGVDWGANINCMVVAQRQGDEFRFLKNFFVKPPKIIDHLIDDEFAPYYRKHRNKKIYLWYDATGNNKQANERRTYAQQLKDKLQEHGWTVQLMTERRDNESHLTKYQLWNALLKGDDPRMPKILFNKSNCNELWISMTTAPAKQGQRSAIQKDKSSERNQKMDQEHATHFSDAADVIIVGMFVHLLTQRRHELPSSRFA